MSKPLKWTTVKRKVNDLVPLKFNPRKITEERLKRLQASMEKFNLAEIPIINFDNTLIGGNQRMRVMQALGRGEEVIDVRYPNRLLTEQELKEYALTSNTHAGEWDFDLLELEFGDFNLEDFDIQLPNFDQEFADESHPAPEAQEDDFEEPEPETVQTDIVPGDLFEIGVHRLLCGDSTKREDIDRVMNGELADLVITDPPYNVDYTGKTKDALKIGNDKQDDDSFYQFLFDFYSALGAHTKPGGAWYVWHADSEGANFRQAMKDAGIMVKQCLIWVKNVMVMGRQDYHWQHEPCLYGWKEGAAHRWYSDRRQTTVLKFDRPSRNAEHPTMKPVPLIGYLLRNSSKKKDVVADGFLGSGTTMVACDQMDRRCYALEKDPRYCQVIIDRMLRLAPNITIKKNGLDVTKAARERIG